MAKASTQELIQDPKVRQEIERHKWFESEKAGHDIGFDRAARDWLDRFGKEWAKKNSAGKKISKAKASAKSPRSRKASKK